MGPPAQVNLNLGPQQPRHQPTSAGTSGLVATTVPVEACAITAFLFFILWDKTSKIGTAFLFLHHGNWLQEQRLDCLNERLCPG